MASSTITLQHLNNLFSSWPTDWIIIGAVAAFLALDALRSSGVRESALSLTLPATIFALGMLPQAIFIGSVSNQFSTPVLQAVLFGIMFVVVYVLVYRVIGLWSVGTGGPIEALIMGVGAAAVLVVVWLQVPALDSLWHFGPQVHAVFGEAYRFWWVAAAYLGLAFARS